MSNKEQVIFSTEEMNNMIKDSLQFQQTGPVTCLGREFPNDQARRDFFREELRKKLPELRQIEGFPIGEDDDIINLSDPPYYTACPNPWLNDFIFERKGIFRLYDLKTIIGKASVMNRLLESVGQSNRVLLNMVTEYNGTSLGRCINKYFERNPYAVEVLLFKRNKVISITRRTVAAKNFISTFCRLYYK